MKKYRVEKEIGIELDESKFTPEFLAAFDGHIFEMDGGIEGHRRRLVELYADGRIDNSSDVEGYGKLSDLGIRFTDIYTEVIDEDEEDENESDYDDDEQ